MASSATVFSGAQFGLASDVSSTGLVVGKIDFTASSETAELPDHIGNTIGVAIYNPRKEVSIDGIIAAKGTGLVGDIGDTLTLAESTNNSRAKLTEGLDVTAVAGAGLMITGNTISPTQTGFEGGAITAIYRPFTSASSPYTAT